MDAEDLRHMTTALALGRRGRGRVWPNPAVGCVIVREGQVVGRGWTADGGRPHAEVRALAQAGAAARGATAYVTLEPCAHHGRTAPCAEALVAAGIARVVSAATDPDSRVAGRGHAILRAAGISVTEGVGTAEAQRDHQGFFLRVTAGRPMLTLKLAASLDGRIATEAGESQWITGAAARHAVHAMRATHDAVMVGAGTVRADDPLLTVRGLGIDRQPVRVVLSRRLDLPRDGRFGRSAAEWPLWLCHGEDAPAEAVRAWRDLGAECLAVPVDGGGLDVGAALGTLGARGVTRVFCEGGGALGAALMRRDLVDRLVVFHAGLALGAEGRAALGPLAIDRLDAAPRFRRLSVRPVGEDIVSDWARV